MVLVTIVLVEVIKLVNVARAVTWLPLLPLSSLLSWCW